jgi:hypothetical protein
MAYRACYASNANPCRPMVLLENLRIKMATVRIWPEPRKYQPFGAAAAAMPVLPACGEHVRV